VGNDREHSQFGIPGTSFAGEGDAGKSRTRRYAVSNDSGKQQQRNSNGFVQQKNYPAFPMGTNRFRALLPTTPLDRPGTRQIQVAGDGKVQNLSVQVRVRSHIPSRYVGTPHPFL